jgi:hypothetical protein
MRRKFLALLPLALVRVFAGQTQVDAPGQIRGTIPVTLPFAFADAELPAGMIDGKNAAFTLAHAPQGASLQLVRNGLTLLAGAANDYTLAGVAITFSAGAVPQAGDNLQAWYRF